MTTHKFDVPYLEQDLGEVEVTFIQKNSADGRVVVDGNCPRCEGYTATEYAWGVPGSGTKGILGGKPRQQDVLGSEVLYCECGYLHPNQPANPVFLGCGASWRVVRS